MGEGGRAGWPLPGRGTSSQLPFFLDPESPLSEALACPVLSGLPAPQLHWTFSQIRNHRLFCCFGLERGWGAPCVTQAGNVRIDES